MNEKHEINFEIDLIKFNEKTHHEFFVRFSAMMIANSVICFFLYSFFLAEIAKVQLCFLLVNSILALSYVFGLKTRVLNKIIPCNFLIEVITINSLLPNEAFLGGYNIAGVIILFSLLENRQKDRGLFLSKLVLTFGIGCYLYFNENNHNYSIPNLPLLNTLLKIDVYLFIFTFVFLWIDLNKKISAKILNDHQTLIGVMNAIPLPIFCKDTKADFKMVYFNNAALDYWGVSYEEAFQKNDTEIYNGKLSIETLNQLRDADLEAIKLKKPQVIKSYRLVNKLGQSSYLNSTKIPINDRYVVTIPEDITERHRTKLDLENYKYALDNSAIISLTDLDGTILYVNDKFSEVSGYDKEELIGENHRKLKSAHQDSHFYKNMWQSISNGNVWHGEICNKKKNGDFYWMYCSIIPLKNDLGQIDKYFSIRFEISDKKMAEQGLVQNEKLTTLGEMSAGIFHEINNPLTILKNKIKIVDRLSTNQALDENFFKSVESIKLNIDRIEKITKSLKSYSRNSSFDPMENVLLEEVISESIILCHDKIIKNKIELKHKKENIDYYISCRKTEISQVVINLINNAADAISTMDSEKERWIEIKYFIEGEQIILDIVDCGEGIPEQVISKMMMPFFTTKAAGKGTGLGLSISQKIISAHHGKLSYLVLDGHTCFRIQFPKQLQEIGTKKAA